VHRHSEPSTPYSLAAPTNPATGKSVVDFFSGASKDLTVVDNGDGTITLRTAMTGVPDEITLSDGTVAIKDVGRIVFVTVIDYHGTPTDTSDDEELSQSIESISGPHPEAERLHAVLPHGGRRGSRSCSDPRPSAVLGSCWVPGCTGIIAASSVTSRHPRAPATQGGGPAHRCRAPLRALATRKRSHRADGRCRSRRTVCGCRHRSGPGLLTGCATSVPSTRGLGGRQGARPVNAEPADLGDRVSVLVRVLLGVALQAESRLQRAVAALLEAPLARRLRRPCRATWRRCRRLLAGRRRS
jgi:hypothetical protein